jgi:hypothetical protein
VINGTPQIKEELFICGAEQQSAMQKKIKIGPCRYNKNIYCKWIVAIDDKDEMMKVWAEREFL